MTRAEERAARNIAHWALVVVVAGVVFFTVYLWHRATYDPTPYRGRGPTVIDSPNVQIKP